MWYVVQVVGGQEEETAALIRKQISPSVMKESFIPKKERIKKFRGRWQQVEEMLFPGYVFTVTDKPEELFLELKRVTRLTKLLQDGTNFFIPLSKEEEEMIQSIGDNYHVTRVSKVVIEADEEIARKVRILEGPLKDHEGCIVGWNLHKREVTVRVEFMGKHVDLRLGVDLVQ